MTPFDERQKKNYSVQWALAHRNEANQLLVDSHQFIAYIQYICITAISPDSGRQQHMDSQTAM